MQHNHHCQTRVVFILDRIMIALGCFYDLSDWYAIGDELI